MQFLKTEIGATIQGGGGEIIRNIPFRASPCLLKQFLQLLSCQMLQLTTSIMRTNGLADNIPAYSRNFKVIATTDTSYGTQIGSGETNPVALDDYCLESQLTTNIAHQAVTVATENPDSSTWRLAISRGFLNNGSASVDVKEVGLVVIASGASYIMIDRTLYEVSFGVGETLTITHRISISL